MADVAATVAHDLRNALQAISHQVELLCHASGPEAVRDRAELILKTLEASAPLVGLLCPNAPLPPPAPPQPVDLNHLLGDVAELTRGSRSREGDGASLELALGEVPPVSGDPAELMRVFTNLLINAHEAVGAHGHIRVSTRHSRGRVFATICDDGAGMTAATRRRLFRQRYSTKGGAERGLGLSIVAEILRRHEGHVLVKSSPGHGATFSVSLRPWQEARGAVALPEVA